MATPIENARNLPVDTPLDWTPPLPTTGTVDDLDEPEDEREDENEIPVRAPSDTTEAPEEFEEDEDDDDEDDEDLEDEDLDDIDEDEDDEDEDDEDLDDDEEDVDSDPVKQR